MPLTLHVEESSTLVKSTHEQPHKESSSSTNTSSHTHIGSYSAQNMTECCSLRLMIFVREREKAHAETLQNGACSVAAAAAACC
eukprot:21192-Heterococcus_DN1.PRE.2